MHSGTTHYANEEGRFLPDESTHLFQRTSISRSRSSSNRFSGSERSRRLASSSSMALTVSSARIFTRVTETTDAHRIDHSPRRLGRLLALRSLQCSAAARSCWGACHVASRDCNGRMRLKPATSSHSSARTRSAPYPLGCNPLLLRRPSLLRRAVRFCHWLAS